MADMERKLTHAQKRVWLSEMKLGETKLNNIGGYFKIQEKLECIELQNALNKAVEKYDTLRLTFAYNNDNEVVQKIKKYRPLYFNTKKFNSREKFNEWIQEEFQQTFSIIESEFLFRFTIFQVEEKIYGVVLRAHHIILDGWSINLILNYIIQMYKLGIGERLSYERKNEQGTYEKFIEYEKNLSNLKRMDIAKKFWKDKFDGVSEEFLYYSYGSTVGNRKEIDFSDEFCKNIREFLKERNLSLNCLAMMAVVLYSHYVTGENDITVGTVTHNRVTRILKNTAGMMANTVAIRFWVKEEEKISDFIVRFCKVMNECMRYQFYPYDEIIKKINIGSKGFDSLFMTSVNCYSIKCLEKIREKEIEIHQVYNGEQSYSTQLVLCELPDNNIKMIFDYKKYEYDELEVELMLNAFKYLIGVLITENEKLVCDFYITDKKKMLSDLKKFNSTCTNQWKKTTSQLFVEIVRNNAQVIAVECEEEKITYAEIDKKICQMSNFLNKQGIYTNSIVGIIQEPSIALIISIFAVLRCGATYIPIDCRYPKERIRYMIMDSKCDLLLTDSSEIEEIEETVNIRNINLENYCDKFEDKSCIEGLAYIIYTSGSTGKPKGVMIGNDNLVNYLQWAKKIYAKNDRVIMPLYTSISFDLTVTSIFLPLLTGGTLIVYDEINNDFILQRIVQQNKVNIIKLTPAHMQLMQELSLAKSKVHTLIVGGDDLKSEIASLIYYKFHKNINIYNEYGPTEVTVGCMIHRYTEQDRKRTSVPIGRPADNTHIYILDKKLNVVPIGKTGEIYISGNSVSRGYLNLPEQNVESFIENPFEKGTLMYKTGDAARFISLDKVEYVGRLDKQIKIRGFRIELGEIENCLRKNSSIKDVVAVYCDRKEIKEIITYVILNDEISIEDIKEHCKIYLPNYMIPQHIIPIEQIPLNTNGKIDYKKLPLCIERSENDSKEMYTEFEKEMLEQIRQTLKVEKVYLHDNFFELGGDSISAIRFSIRLKKINYEIKVKDIIDASNLKEIIEKIEKKEIEKKDYCHGLVPKSPIHHWFFEQKFKNENDYSQYVQIYLSVPIQIDELQDAFNKLIREYDTLRMNYDEKNGVFIYNELYLNKEVLINSIILEEQSNLKEYMYELRKERSSLFELMQSCLFDLSVVNTNENQQILLFMAHHVVVDAISWRILIRSFFDILNGKEVETSGVSYQEWSNKMYMYAKRDFSEEMSYWSLVEQESLHFEQENVSEIKQAISFSRDFVIQLEDKINTIFNLKISECLVIALVIAIERKFRIEKMVIDLEGHGRDVLEDMDVSESIGWFTNLYSAYFCVLDKALIEQLIDLKEQLRSIPNCGKNYGVICYLKTEKRNKYSNNVRFNYLGKIDEDILLEQKNVSGIEFGIQTTNVSNAVIDVNAFMYNDNLVINCSTSYLQKQVLFEFTQIYRQVIYDIYDACVNSESINLSISDFDLLNISQDEFNNLFGE